MRLYREDGHSFSFNNENEIGCGSFGSVYKLSNDVCYKIFKYSISRKEENCEFNEEIFNILKGLKLKNFYTLYEIFYNRTLTRILGYSSKYYESEDIDILTMPTDYTLNNLYNMYDSIKRISEQKIIVNDMHDDNIIMNSNEITVIDTDLYYKSIKSNYIDQILKMNTNAILYLFNFLYYSALDKYHNDNFLHYSENMENLFFPCYEDSVDIVCKKLIKYKYPIDYLRRK